MTVVPDNTFLPIGVLTTEPILHPNSKLVQIRSFISKLSESKIGYEKIFGRVV